MEWRIFFKEWFNNSIKHYQITVWASFSIWRHNKGLLIQLKFQNRASFGWFLGPSGFIRCQPLLAAVTATMLYGGNVCWDKTEILQRLSWSIWKTEILLRNCWHTTAKTKPRIGWDTVVATAETLLRNCWDTTETLLWHC